MKHKTATLLASPLLAIALVAGASFAGIGQVPAAAAERIVEAPVAARKANESAGLKTAIFAGGCFWGVEAVYSHMKGVKSAVSGYHGGTAGNAVYKKVSRGQTKHAEAVKVVYDPKVVRYDQLVRVLFSVIADPTLKNRQGPDVGEHYRAALVPLSDEQRIVATSYLAQMGKSGKWDRPIVVNVEKAKKFYAAEDYHQDFAKKNPNHGYIQRWDAPKVVAFKRLYPSLYRGVFKTG